MCVYSEFSVMMMSNVADGTIGMIGCQIDRIQYKNRKVTLTKQAGFTL